MEATDMDHDQLAVLRFVAERGRVRWGDVRSLTAIGPGTVSGLVLAGHLAARCLGDENHLVDTTELSLAEKGQDALSQSEGKAPVPDGLPVSSNQMALF